jgi:hypothetical protein
VLEEDRQILVLDRAQDDLVCGRRGGSLHLRPPRCLRTFDIGLSSLPDELVPHLVVRVALRARSDCPVRLVAAHGLERSALGSFRST